MASSASNVPFLICSLLFTITICFGKEPYTLLSTLKEKSFEFQQRKNAAESSQLEYSWINPITIGYDYSYSNQFDRTQINRSFSVRVDQPIFKSGGIWYAVKYAKASFKVGDLGIESQRKSLIKQAVSSLFNIKKSEYQIDKQKLLVENDRIDIERKKEQYMSGDLDGSFLDQAILQKNRDMMTLFSLQESLALLRKNFADLSDMDPEKVKLPHFSLVEKKRFIDTNIDLALRREQIAQKEYFNILTLTKYLPTLSLQGAWIKPFKNGLIYLSGYPNVAKSYYTYGFRASLPIDITSYHTIESSRVDYLRAKIELSDKKVEAENLYKSVLSRLEVIDKKLALAKEDEDLYTNLVKKTKEKVKAGEMTIYDLKTMENSRSIRQIDQKIYEIERQLVLLDLYEKMYDDSV